MEAFLVSILAVAISEIGDKTQLLSLLLAARFQRPVPIILGILCATVVNHAIAGAVGAWVRSAIGPGLIRWGLGISFLAVAAWALVPDRLEKDPIPEGRYGVFLITLTAFFLAEIGDKTQLATVMLATKYDAIIAVVGGTTLGMLLADIPVVLVGSAASRAMPFKAARLTAAGIFGVLGVATLLGFGSL